MEFLHAQIPWTATICVFIRLRKLRVVVVLVVLVVLLLLLVLLLLNMMLRDHVGRRWRWLWI